MSWIRIVPESEAEGKLKDIYHRISSSRGKVSNIMRVQSLQPGAMEAHLDLYMQLLFKRGGLSRPERELIAVAVSRENGCRYCTLHHEAALEAWWKDADRVAAFRKGPGEASLNERETALVQYAVKLTAEPEKVEQEDVEALRRAGLSEEEILQANLIASYFNFANRIANGLGVDAPPDEVSGYRY